MTSDSSDAEGAARTRYVTQVFERFRAPLTRYLKSLLSRREDEDGIALALLGSSGQAAIAARRDAPVLAANMIGPALLER